MPSLSDCALSYITSSGEEIILDNYQMERNIWEIYGRTGFDAPALEYQDEIYADGYSETLAVRIPPRDIAINLVIRGSTMYGRDMIVRQTVNKLLEHGVRNSWGKLRIKRSDGSYVYLNCHYSGGFDTVAMTDPKITLLNLNFHASDPFFYSEDETEFYYSDTEQIGLYFGDEFYFDSRTYFMGGNVTSETIVKNDGQIAYPVITVTGPAKNLKFVNSRNNGRIEIDENFVLAAGETLIIDCRDRMRGITLRDSGGQLTDKTNLLKLGSSLVFPIEQGDNNIEITYTDTSAATSVDFVFQKRWLSA